MDGTLAALIALATQANEWLDSGRETPTELLGANDTFQYIRRFTVTAKHAEVAAGTAGWLSLLRRSGATRVDLVSLRRGPDSGLVERAPAWALTARGDGAATWVANWRVVDQAAPDSRIWEVELAEAARITASTSPDQAQCRRRLREAISQFIDYTASQGLTGWDAPLIRARAQLESNHPELAYYQAMLPESGVPLARRQLVAAASHSWIFGGMGGWNDQGREGEQAYDDVTERLRQAATQAFLAGVNGRP